MIPHAEAAKSVMEQMPGVDLTHKTAEETYFIAQILMDADKFLLSLVGLEHNVTVFTVVYAVLVFLLAYAVGLVLQWLVVAVIHKFGDHFHSDLYQNLHAKHFFTKTARVIPAILFLILIQFTLNDKEALMGWLSKFAYIWISWIMSNSVCLMIDAVWTHIDQKANKKKLPLKGLMQLVKGFVWAIFIIIAVAVLLDKSPAKLFAGLGAFAAVLMLIFKDSILGLVAGVQLSQNDSLHVGDWIKVNGTDANGIVQEVSLTAVKVLNWDRTTTSLPPYSLISGSFTNYKSMQESNTRRIQRSYMIDADSVVPTDDNMLAEFAKLPLMKDWIAKKIEQRNAGKTCDASNPEGLADGSIETNLGVFRAYLTMYLKSNPNFSVGGFCDCFVTTLQQTAYGIPLQIYCFTSTSKWLQYEAIMSSLFEHVAAMLYKFKLYTFESESGRDTLIDGWMSPGKNPDVIFGMPYPFFNASGTPENPAYPVQQSQSPIPSAMTPAAPQPTTPTTTKP